MDQEDEPNNPPEEEDDLPEKLMVERGEPKNPLEEVFVSTASFADARVS